MPRPALFAALLALGSVRALPAADSPVEAQKAAAATLAKLGKAPPGRAETAHVLAHAATDAQAKTVADAAERGHKSASAALKLDADAVPGKVAVFALADAKAFKLFSLQALKRSPTAGVVSDVRLRGDNPTVVYVPADKANPDEPAQLVAAGLLNIKAGTAATGGIPTWLEAGFGRAAVLRGEKQDAKLAAHKAKVRALAAKTGGRAFAFTNVWGDKPNPDADLLSTSLADYLAFGPGADKFPAFLGALKPTDDRREPSIDAAFEAAGWELPDAEMAWRKWAAGGGK